MHGSFSPIRHRSAHILTKMPKWEIRCFPLLETAVSLPQTKTGYPLTLPFYVSKDIWQKKLRFLCVLFVLGLAALYNFSLTASDPIFYTTRESNLSPKKNSCKVWLIRFFVKLYTSFSYRKVIFFATFFLSVFHIEPYWKLLFIGITTEIFLVLVMSRSIFIKFDLKPPCGKAGKYRVFIAGVKAWIR